MKSTSRLRIERWLPLLAAGALLLLCGVVLSGCDMLPQTIPTPTPRLAPTRVSQPTPAAGATGAATAIPSDPATLIAVSWEGSGHANSFVADDSGKNNECARCHSPMNWVPTATVDMPKECTLCKFTVSEPKPVVEAEWQAVGCNVCHRVKDGATDKQALWLNALVAQYATDKDPYEPVKSNAELCAKCHYDGGLAQANVDLGNGAHASYDCAKCHDAHSAKASCTAAGCHPDALKPATPIAGHDKNHASVSCVACHDAAGLKVGPAQDKTWVTLRDAFMPGQTGAVPYVSHNLQRKVDCARCHYAGNPWQLKADVK